MRRAVTHPRLTLAIWAAVVGVLALLGLGVADRLHRSSLEIPGTASSDAVELARDHFGEGTTLVVLLRGPRGELERQRDRLAATLEQRRGLAVLPLRPGPGRSLLVLRSERTFEEVSRDVVPRVRADVREVVRAPVAAHVTGYPDVAAGIHGGTLAAVSHAELIAAPILLLVLLLVFRSLIAAALPLLVGFTTIGAAGGVLELANRVLELDAVALNLASMMGLALGVDYSLLLVSRFREELAEGRDARAAALVSVETAGRTVAFAGVALVAAMATAYLIAPGNLLSSASFGTVVSAVLSVGAALTAVPAMLALLGPRLDRFAFRLARPGTSRFGTLALRAVRRPAIAAGLVLVAVTLLSAPAIALETGPPDARVLPEGSAERTDLQAISDSLGSGWTAPYEITIAVREGTITDPERLAALDRWQRRIAGRPDVRAVLGPGPVARRARGAGRAPRQLERADDALRSGLRDGERLRDGLERASTGVDELRGGLALAAEGAGRLDAGGGGAAEGASLVADGVARARRGAERLRAGLADAADGGAALAEGAGRARDGTRRLRAGLERARAGTGEARPRVDELAAGLDEGARGLERLREPAALAQRELRAALSALDRMLLTSRLDPQYARLYKSVATASGAVSGRHPLTGRPVEDGYDGIDAELAGASQGLLRAVAGVRELGAGLARLETGLAELTEGAGELQDGAARLDAGAGELLRGLERLQAGGEELEGGLERLADGGSELAAGIERLAGGAAELERGLRDGSGRTGELRRGLARMEEGAATAQIRVRRLGRGLEDADRLADAVRSGYFVLAALDGAPPPEREAATFAVNLDRGGSAAQMVVVGEGAVARSGHPLRKTLERELASLERETGAQARLGGPATVLQDFDSETFGRFWLLVVGLAVVTYLVLVAVLRSLLLPLLAVVLNLLTVAAAFGVLVLLFQGDAPLGGPGFLDAIMAAGIFSVVFGLSIDYEVFLLTRMREGRELTGTTDGAIAYGLQHTASVVTGAALIMTGVFVAFALADIASMRQLGIGMTVAVLLDATVVRLVLLPAAIRLCGGAAWWFPRLPRRRPAALRS